MTTRKVKRYNNAGKYKYWRLIFVCVKYKCKTWQEHARGKKSIHSVSRCRANGRKKCQGGLVRAWNGFLLNVFNFMGHLRWWGKLFHANEPEKETLVLKISILALGKSCLFPWTWRRSKGIMRSFKYCGVLPWTTFALKHICWVILVCLEGVVWEHITFDCSPY